MEISYAIDENNSVYYCLNGGELHKFCNSAIHKPGKYISKYFPVIIFFNILLFPICCNITTRIVVVFGRWTYFDGFEKFTTMAYQIPRVFHSSICSRFDFSRKYSRNIRDIRCHRKYKQLAEFLTT